LDCSLASGSARAELRLPVTPGFFVVATHGPFMIEPLSLADAAERSDAVMDRVASAAVIDRPVLETIFTAVVARGHVLLEDVPGTGKTVTARLLAEALGLDFARIQFTPDLLPSDITGSNVYDEHEGAFRFSKGPVFTNVVLADEINRAPPKTQAALLEAMEERQVSIDGETHRLPEPFFVIATQNPIEQEGTFRLPEAQRDRFSVKTSLGYPEIDGEMELLARRASRRTHAPTVEAVTDTDTVRALRQVPEEIEVDEDVRRYIIHLARATRADTRTDVGVSPRGIQRVFETARARAVIAGREYVTPDDVKAIAVPSMTHRIVLTTEASVEGVDPRRIVRNALDTVDVPGVAPDANAQPTFDETAQQPPQGSRQPRQGGQPHRGQPPRQGSQPPRDTRAGNPGQRPPESGGQPPQGRRNDTPQGRRNDSQQGRPGGTQRGSSERPTDAQRREAGNPRDQQPGPNQRQPRDDQQSPDSRRSEQPRDDQPDEPRRGDGSNRREGADRDDAGTDE